jgi:hypothetical protein
MIVRAAGSDADVVVLVVTAVVCGCPGVDVVLVDDVAVVLVVVVVVAAERAQAAARRERARSEMRCIPAGDEGGSR